MIVNFLKLVLAGLVILLAYGYFVKPSPQQNVSGGTSVPDYSGFNSQTTATQDGAALAARDAARDEALRRADPSVCLELPSYKAIAGEYSVEITGSIKNTCGRSFRYVQVTFKLFDRSEAVVGTALANQSNLDAGETWKFKAHPFTEFAKFRLDKITAY